MAQKRTDSSKVVFLRKKTQAELNEWWLNGVREMAKQPLADWKTDNPNHPNHMHSWSAVPSFFVYADDLA